MTTEGEKIAVLRHASGAARRYAPGPEPEPEPAEQGRAAAEVEPPPAPPPCDPAAAGPDVCGKFDGGAWLPHGFPITPLGMQGTTCFFLDSLGQILSFPFKEVARANIEGMMGTRAQLLDVHWPRIDDKGRIKGWRPEDAGRALKEACAERGVWSPEERVRGAGGWRGEDGELILHLGNTIAVYPVDGGRPRLLDPGVVGELVYPSRPALPAPATKPERGNGGGVGMEVLADISTWNFQRPDVDPALLLGHCVAGVLGGALDWRPLGWITGGKGSGKSTLQKYFGGALGRWVVRTSDATGAGIWQKLGFDCRPVNIDEAEAEEDGRRMSALLALARTAASGDVVLRGGSDHTGREFQARSSFLFSSIGMPPFNSADRSRIVVYALRPLPEGAKRPDLAPRRLEGLGRRLLRRIVDQWPRFEATLALYQQAMEEAGHSQRGCDVFGTLLACHDLALYDQVPDSDTLALWTERLRVGGLTELAGDMAIEWACLGHMLTKPIEAYRGGSRHPLQEWVKQAAMVDWDGQPSDEARIAGDILRSYGLEVRAAPLDKETREPRWPGRFLWVPYRHATFASLFDRSKWQGGVDTVGGWVQHLGWLPNAHGNVSYYVGGRGNKAVLVPLDLCLRGSADAEPDDEPSGAAVASTTRLRCAPDTAPADPAAPTHSPDQDRP